MKTHCQLTHLHLLGLQILLFLCLALYRFNLSIYNLFALLQILSLNILRNTHVNKKDAKQLAHYWPVLTLRLSWPYSLNVRCY